MSSRLRSTGALALIVFFLMITAVCAPVAFFLGKWRSEFDSAQAASLPSQFGADEPADYAALVAAQRLTRDCGGAGDPHFERIGVWDIPCHPYREVSGFGAGAAQKQPLRHAAASGAPRTPSRRNGPLENATVRAIAETVMGSTASADGAASPGDPLSLAMAPGLPGLFGTGGLAGGPNAPGGLPGNIIPNIPGGGGPPVEPPPVATVPVPAALPLLLTGLGGLLLAGRRRKG